MEHNEDHVCDLELNRVYEENLHLMIDRESLDERQKNIYDLLGPKFYAQKLRELQRYARELKEWQLEEEREKKREELDRLEMLWVKSVEEEYFGKDNEGR